MRVLPAGPDALLVDLGGLHEAAAVRAALERAALPGIVDVVPGARTVLVTAVPGHPTALPATRELLGTVDLTAVPDATDADAVDLGVHYDGEDLELVARDAGLDVAGVIAHHTGAIFTVAFGGFAPGFAYLTGLPAPLCQPRLDTPRSRVPAGSVGVAGEFGGVYPRASPGGWRLLGRLVEDAPALFDPDRDPPALLPPGTTVRFRDAGRA